MTWDVLLSWRDLSKTKTCTFFPDRGHNKRFVSHFCFPLSTFILNSLPYKQAKTWWTAEPGQVKPELVPGTPALISVPPAQAGMPSAHNDSPFILLMLQPCLCAAYVCADRLFFFHFLQTRNKYCTRGLIMQPRSWVFVPSPSDFSPLVKIQKLFYKPYKCAQAPFILQQAEKEAISELITLLLLKF